MKVSGHLQGSTYRPLSTERVAIQIVIAADSQYHLFVITFLFPNFLLVPDGTTLRSMFSIPCFYCFVCAKMCSIQLFNFDSLLSVKEIKSIVMFNFCISNLI